MQISKIKLAGFKSFVDPTSLMLRGNLTGIVGPNGCGKSNIIDALLWVMGESSAKHLRGDSMADVIFSGSSSRKPVGQATVEIVFDNKDQSLGGQFASYGEISIRRQVTRDGTSVYYLNSARCRRRDITDLFLGKGIGSRSYSVIEQGMISRIIEAKPDDLRLFLEEAAGISKYKERRHETENRLQHTNENLNRLNDIRVELYKQLEHLQQQSRAAEQYQELKASERKIRAELIGLAWRSQRQELEAQDRNIQQRETALEAVLARLRGVEAAIEKARDDHNGATERLNETQGNFYSLGAEVSRLEQGIQHAVERRKTLERDLERAISEAKEADVHISENSERRATLKKSIEIIGPEYERLTAREQEIYEELTRCEQSLQAWQMDWERFHQQATDSLRQEKGETTRIEHLESGLAELRQRLDALRRERDDLDPKGLETAIQDLSQRAEESGLEYQQLLAFHTEKQNEIKRIREIIEGLGQALSQDRHEQQVVDGRLASLKALQESAEAGDQAPVREWLDARGLASAPRLSQHIAVAEGWETAVETVLGLFLHAFHVPRLEGIAHELSSLRQGSLAFIDSAGVENSPSQGPCARLSEKIASSWPLGGLFDHVYSAETMAEALRLRPQLLPHESVVTRDGNWIGAHWLRVHRGEDEKAGVLKRAREIKALERQHQDLEARVSETVECLEKTRGALKELEEEQELLQGRLIAAQEFFGGGRSELAAKETELRQLRSRTARLEVEIRALEDQEFQDAAELSSAKIRLESIQDRVSSVEECRTRQIRDRDALQASLNATRECWREVRENRHELALQLESMRTQHASLEQALHRNRTLAVQITARSNELRTALNELGDPVGRMKDELEEALRKHFSVEEDLRDARAQLQALDAYVREQEQCRVDCEQAHEEARKELEEARMEAQALRVRLEGLGEQLQGLGYEVDALLRELAEGAEKGAWEKRLEVIVRKIARLGPINLAAIDECAQLSERKGYLDRQHNDLTEALETLENAIRKIDRETRSRFKETFDRVNASLQQLFPALFGGGQAHLEMTGEDLLETGVHVIAHPPGKRNSTIHLLSGGEKALTALALVFSIFELNPAPFCLLDEVDAPLDDANVVRLCNLLKARSKDVQFIFITHNKVTMEIAENLIGVTMQEAGVSRLVAVDIDEAMAMATTG